MIRITFNVMIEASRLIVTKGTRKGIQEQREATKEETEETGSCDVYLPTLTYCFLCVGWLVSLCRCTYSSEGGAYTSFYKDDKARSASGGCTLEVQLK